MMVAGIDALSYPCENILTRRANQRHYSIIAQFVKRPWPCPTTCKTPVALPDNGLFGAFAGKNPYRQLKLHRLATAKGRLSRCRAARTSDARARGRSTRPVPLACFAGIWTNWTSVRKVEDAVIASRY